MKTHIWAVAILACATALGVSLGQESPEANRSPQAHVGMQTFEYQNPAIKDYGKVVQLPDASQQPRAGAKIVVDLTKGGPADKLNPALDIVARWVNIYSGAGKEAADVDIALVVHGRATLMVLNDAAYSKRFETEGNPNLECMKVLKDSGVEIFVCGQSLIGSGAKPDEVDPLTNVAVSALTSLVNLQTDGYAFLPLGN